MFRSISFNGAPARGVLGVIATLICSASLAAAQSPLKYTAEFLGNAKHAAAMNESGLVVGTGSIGIYARAYVAGPGKPITYLPLPLGFLSSGATDVNEAGVIVGVMSPYQTTAFYPQPAKWVPDGAGGYTPVLLSTLPGHNRGTADAINDLGDIVGTSAYHADMHTVLFTDAGTLDLPGLGAIPARSINNQRVYVGGSSGAFRVDLETLKVEDLGIPGGYAGAQAWVINAIGKVAGDLTPSLLPGCTQEPAVFTDGLGWEAVGACGTSNSCYDLNAQGDVLMTDGGMPWVRFAGGGAYALEDLVVAGPGHWIMNPVFNMALNDARQMAVYATNGAQSGVVLLTPETVCQTDLGFGGPGALHVSMCGGDLSSGTTAQVLLTGGIPGGLAYMIAGPSAQPTPFLGGTVVPLPWTILLPLAVDGAGEAALAGVPGGHGPFTLYLQFGQLDASQPGGLAISNAVQADFLP